jgi:hypothetical protein
VGTNEPDARSLCVADGSSAWLTDVPGGVRSGVYERGEPGYAVRRQRDSCYVNPPM